MVNLASWSSVNWVSGGLTFSIWAFGKLFSVNQPRANISMIMGPGDRETSGYEEEKENERIFS